MSEQPPSNAKIYARPERKTPSPILIGVIAIFLALAAIVAYKFFLPAAPAANKTTSAVLPPHVAVFVAGTTVVKQSENRSL